MQQRAELQRRIWQIANDVRGSVDDWDFKQYVLGALFYRFISENFANYIEADDEIITPEIKTDAIKKWSDPKKLDLFNSRTEFCNSQGSVLLISPEYAHGCNSECTRGLFFQLFEKKIVFSHKKSAP